MQTRFLYTGIIVHSTVFIIIITNAALLLSAGLGLSCCYPTNLSLATF